MTIENKKEVEPIADSSYYEFKSDSTYTLFGEDLWGKSKVIGKWRLIGKNKIELYDIISRSDSKGTLRKSNYGNEIEIKKINSKQYIFLSSYDKGLGWLHELYYIRVKGSG